MEEYILNKELNDQEIKEGKVILESKPRKLAVILTTKCNLSCIMCPLTHFRAKHKEPNTLPFDKIKQIYRLYPYLQWIDWQGGEVFLIDYFKELFLKAASFPQIQQNLITNGLLIDEEWAKIIAQNNVQMTYSIDSVEKSKYEFIRRGARYGDLIQGLERLNKYRKKYNRNIHFLLNVVVMKCNYKELGLFPEFCRQHGFNHLRFDYLRHEVANQEDLFSERQEEIIDYLNKELVNIGLECKQNGIHFSHPFESFLKNDHPPGQSETPSMPFVPKCKIPWRKITIEDSGGVRIDCKCPQIIGNIITDRIEDIWNGPMIQKYRSSIISGDNSNLCSEICLNYAVENNFFEGV